MPDLSAGSVVAGHRIEAVAGRGGMGVVYRAFDLSLERPVALKVIAPALSEDESFRERFKRESRIAASMRHPNVIPIYSAGEEDGLLYITMDFVEGTDLRALIEAEGRIVPARAAAIVAQVASALDAAHGRGLVHRDVKPANVLLDSHQGREHCYLTDFGLTKSTASKSGITGTGMFVGTIDYMAPEQLEGGHVDARSDVYALGCVLYEALTGEVPYPRPTDAAKMWAHMTEAPPRLRDVAPGLPQVLDEVVSRAMAKRSDDRFQSAGDLGEAATAAAAGRAPTTARGSVATGEAAPTRVATGPTVRGDAKRVEAPTEPVPRRARRRSPLLVAALSALVVGGGVALAIAALGGDGDAGDENGVSVTTQAAAPANEGEPERQRPNAREQIERRIRGHWQRREDGDFAAAWKDMTPSLQADPDVGPTLSQWTRKKEADGLRTADVQVDARSARGGRGVADVVRLTTHDAAGCKQWSGEYALAERGDRWLIDEADIRSTSC